MILHNSMCKVKLLRGVKVGQSYKGKIIKYITVAGEAIFENGEWSYVDTINGSNSDL